MDFAKLGYELFKEKLFDALAMLDTFMEMKPMVLKITRTFIFGNSTNSTDNTNTTLNEINNLSHELQDGQMQSEIESPLEIETELPLGNDDLESQAKIPEPLETNTDTPIKNKDTVSSLETNKNSHSIELTKSQVGNEIKQPIVEFSQNNDETYYDNSDIQKTKVNNEGVVGKVVGAVGSFFKSMWNWFTG